MAGASAAMNFFVKTTGAPVRDGALVFGEDLPEDFPKIPAVVGFGETYRDGVLNVAVAAIVVPSIVTVEGLPTHLYATAFASDDIPTAKSTDPESEALRLAYAARAHYRHHGDGYEIFSCSLPTTNPLKIAHLGMSVLQAHMLNARALAPTG